MNSRNIIDFFSIACLRFLEMKEDFDRQICQQGDEKNEYEGLLQKAEANIRSQISVCL